MKENYGSYLTSELLTEFLNDSINAPGRLTSSPWPDRIEITSTEKTEEGLYKVTDVIIEVTSVEQGTENAAAKRPITLDVKKVDGRDITQSDIRSLMQNLGQNAAQFNNPAGKKQLLEEAIAQELIYSDSIQQKLE